jgi:hypothetical protein
MTMKISIATGDGAKNVWFKDAQGIFWRSANAYDQKWHHFVVGGTQVCQRDHGEASGSKTQPATFCTSRSGGKQSAKPT